MDLLKGIDALFKLDVIRWELSLHHISSASLFPRDGMKAIAYLIVCLSKLLLQILLGSPGKR